MWFLCSTPHRSRTFRSNEENSVTKQFDQKVAQSGHTGGKAMPTNLRWRSLHILNHRVRFWCFETLTRKNISNLNSIEVKQTWLAADPLISCCWSISEANLVNCRLRSVRVTSKLVLHFFCCQRRGEEMMTILKFASLTNWDCWWILVTWRLLISNVNPGGGVLHSSEVTYFLFTQQPLFDSWYSHYFFSCCCWDLMTALLTTVDRGSIMTSNPTSGKLVAS